MARIEKDSLTAGKARMIGCTRTTTSTGGRTPVISSPPCFGAVSSGFGFEVADVNIELLYAFFGVMFVLLCHSISIA